MKHNCFHFFFKFEKCKMIISRGFGCQYAKCNKGQHNNNKDKIQILKQPSTKYTHIDAHDLSSSWNNIGKTYHLHGFTIWWPSMIPFFRVGNGERKHVSLCVHLSEKYLTHKAITFTPRKYFGQQKPNLSWDLGLPLGLTLTSPLACVSRESGRTFTKIYAAPYTVVTSKSTPGQK